jgi:uncharacterized membrane protein YcaP (DUF421 family)
MVDLTSLASESNFPALVCFLIGEFCLLVAIVVRTNIFDKKSITRMTIQAALASFALGMFVANLLWAVL